MTRLESPPAQPGSDQPLEDFLTKLAGDQERLRRHLRGQGVRFKSFGDALAQARENESRVFVVGEDSLELVARVVADEYLHSWPVVPVSLTRPDDNELDDVDSGSEVSVIGDVSSTVKDIARHFRAGDMVLAFVHSAESRPLRELFKLACKRELLVLMIGGLDARKALRGVYDIYLPLPTRGVKTITEASFLCARLIARIARSQSRDESEAEALLRVVCRTCGEANFVPDDPDGPTDVDLDCRDCGAALRAPRSRRRRFTEDLVEFDSDQDDERSPGRRPRSRTEKTRRRRTRSSSQARRRPSSEDLDQAAGESESVADSQADSRSSRDRRPATRRHKRRREKSSTHKRPGRSSGRSRSESLESTAAEPDNELNSDETEETERTPSGRRRRKSRKTRRPKTAARSETDDESRHKRRRRRDETSDGDGKTDSRPMTISESEPESEPAGDDGSFEPGQINSVEILGSDWMDDDAVPAPIGIGSSFKSSGIFGDIAMDSDELTPRYILDAIRPDNRPDPGLDSLEDEALTSDEGSRSDQRFVSNRFVIQQCRLRFAVGAFPDSSVPRHPLINLERERCAFQLGSDDVALATLSPGDELWLRIDIPAFIDPILARARIAGFEASEEEEGLRVELSFAEIDPEHRRRINLAAESLTGSSR